MLMNFSPMKNFCLISTAINYGKTKNQFDRTNFLEYFGTETIPFKKKYVLF